MESWTFVPPLLPCWRHERTWATPNRKTSTSGSYGCLSWAIHQAQKPAREVRNPTSETRLSWLRVPCSHWMAVSVPWCEWSVLDGTRQGGPPTPTGWLPPSFLTVLKEPGNELTPFCQLVTLGESFLKCSVDCRSRSHKSCSLRIYQDQVAPD